MYFTVTNVSSEEARIQVIIPYTVLSLSEECQCIKALTRSQQENSDSISSTPLLNWCEDWDYADMCLILAALLLLPAWDTAAGSSAGGLDAPGTCKRSTRNSFWKRAFICFIFKQQENLKSGPHFQTFRVGRAEDKGRYSCLQQAHPSVVPCHNHSRCSEHVCKVYRASCLRAAPLPPATYHSESCSAKSAQWWTPHS